jgi:hypothetical protein
MRAPYLGEAAFVFGRCLFLTVAHKFVIPSEALSEPQVSRMGEAEEPPHLPVPPQMQE